MSKREADEVTGVETTGHEWDGIRELDNPLPRWWLYMFWAGIVAAIIYWILMPAWPGLHGYTHGILHQSDRADLTVSLKELQTVRGTQAARVKSASLEEIERDPEMMAYAQAVGQSVFGDNCATCHGTGGTGSKGYPNLRDDVWLWGGTLQDIYHTIDVGIRADNPHTRFSQMPAFGRDQMLTDPQVSDLTEYVVALSGRPANPAAVRRAAPIFQTQCSACHAVDGTGDQKQGAPNLTDQVWLYGPTRPDIQGQIWNGRGGVMPSWHNRFSPETLKALAVYIHANAGGQ